MAILMPRIIQAKQILRRSLSNGSSNTYMAIPKGYFAVYVGEQEKKRFVVPVSLLGQPAFQELLCQAEEEFGFNHPMGGITIPCSKEIFTDLAARFGFKSKKVIFAVYVGEQEKKRFVVPLSLLSQPSFQELLNQAEEEFGYNHPMGGLTIPCSEDIFTDLASRLGSL